MKRILTLALAAVMLLTTFAACTDGEEFPIIPADTQEPIVTEEPIPEEDEVDVIDVDPSEWETADTPALTAFYLPGGETAIQVAAERRAGRVQDGTPQNTWCALVEADKVESVIDMLNREYYDKHGYQHLARAYKPAKGSSIEY